MIAHRIRIEPDGRVAFIYDDALLGVARALRGHVERRRVSHVEPYRDGWMADMSPVGGPLLLADKLTRTPFATRAAALEAERGWLREHRGL